MRGVLAVAVLAGVAAGCAGPCAEVAARRSAVTGRTAVAPGPHARVRLPLARANQLLAPLVDDPALRVALDWHGQQLSAQPRRVELQPAPDQRLRFAISLDIADAVQPITTLAMIVEVEPRLVRSPDSSDLVAGFSPANLVSVTPQLGPGAASALADAAGRWLGSAVTRHLPRALLERAASEAAGYLTGKAFDLLRATLLPRLGELTQLRIRLPALPIAATRVTSTADAITVDLTTDLPVRQGLAAPAAGPASDDAVVEISASTAAALANWSIDRGHLPQHYARDLAPRADGEYRPWFDYVAGEPRRPVKIHIFQDRGGCSYFQVGLRYRIAVVGDQVEVDVVDRIVESAIASAPLELGLWLVQLLRGSVDRSYRAVARTRLTIGRTPFEARVTGAATAGDDLRFTVRLAPPGDSRALTARLRPGSRPVRSAGARRSLTSRAGPVP